MRRLNIYRSLPIWLLVFFLVVPLQVHAEESNVEPGVFSQEELDQIVAPVALYPDALLGQVMMAATYPLEVVLADRWLQQNKDLKGDDFEEALDAQPWDPSVKALTAFPDLLAAMSENPEWMQNLGDAFLAQQADVMDTVQKLRKKAYEAGNLKTTAEQKVIAEKEIIRIEPADPRVVYVPVYDPWWVYGPWWWHAYPPYVVYPHYAGVVIAPGHIWFSVGFFVGAFWGNWGYCDWPRHHIYVRPYHYRHYRQYAYHRTPAGRNVPGHVWTHNPSHRRGVAYRGHAIPSRFGQAERPAPHNGPTLTRFRQQMPGRNGTRDGTVSRPGRAPGVSDRPNTPTTVSPQRPEPREPGRNVKPTRPGVAPRVTNRPNTPPTVSPQRPEPREPTRNVVPIKPGLSSRVTNRPNSSPTASPQRPEPREPTRNVVPIKPGRPSPAADGSARPNSSVNNPAAETGRNPYVFGGAGWNSQTARQNSWGQSRPPAGAQAWPGSLGRSLGGARGNSSGSRNGGLFSGTMRGGRR